MNSTPSVKDQVWETLLQYLQNTKDFVLEQAPDVLQQALRYEKVSTWFSITTSAMLLVVAFATAWYFWKHPNLDKYGSREFPSILGVVIPLCVFMPLLGSFYCSVDRIIKIYVAPKYFLISLIMNLKN